MSTNEDKKKWARFSKSQKQTYVWAFLTRETTQLACWWTRNKTSDKWDDGEANLTSINLREHIQQKQPVDG